MGSTRKKHASFDHHVPSPGINGPSPGIDGPSLNISVPSSVEAGRAVDMRSLEDEEVRNNSVLALAVLRLRTGLGNKH